MLSCQQDPKSLSIEQPVFSLAMSELVVCHTAIGKEQRVCICISIVNSVIEIFIAGISFQSCYTDGWLLLR